jgi:hypothetical protein
VSALPYKLSFTSGGLLAREATVAAPLYLRSHDWALVRAEMDADNLLQARTISSGSRTTRELVQRLSTLSQPEVELLVDATSTERGHMMWAAACRRYELIGDFAEDVMREKVLLLNPILVPKDFDGFVRSKALWRAELEATTDSTMRKLRTNLFLMLREAGFLSDDRHIVASVLSQRVATVLAARTPSDIRFFPVVDLQAGTVAR